ncbi:uncharacterized protein LOC133905272 isoform X3 [Phragmites australis]|uniref:uncharacterized protein LOC133905272 isoform X3 n=1 Tax=Phragmites australis TaxID=29695 RepID=UPI002D79DAE2|nr:uncharacterized protein LOC133905272 isoform X3 [Phragmites australis]
MDFAAMKRRGLQALCKRHGLPAGGSNADLAARLAAALPGAAGAVEEVVARKGCLKRSDGGSDSGEAKEVTFALEEEAEARGRRRRSLVICSPVVVAKTRGRGKTTETLPSGSPAAEVSGRGQRQRRRAEVGGGSAAEDGVAAEAGAGAPVRWSRKNLVNLSAAEPDEVGEAVAIDRKRKRKSQEQAENIPVSAQDGVSCRITRRSSLSAAAVLLPPAVGKKRGRRKAEEQVAEAQDLAAAASSAIVENKRSGRKGEDCEPAVQKSAKVEASGRSTRSRSLAASAMSTDVAENKRRKTEDVQPDVELPRNDAPVTRALRNRLVQVNSTVMEETHVGKKLENKRQPSRPATRRHQQLASFVEEEDQEELAAPRKCPPLRRSGRNNSEASNANSETNKSSSAPVEAKDLNIARPVTSHNAKGEYVEKQPAVKEPVRRSTRKSVVSAMLEKEEKDLIAEKCPEAHVRRPKRKSVLPVKDIKGVGGEIQNAKGEDVEKQQTVKKPVRRSARKSVVSAMLEKEEKDLIAEKNLEAHVRRSMPKSVVLVKDIKGVGEEIQNSKGEDVDKQLVVKRPVRRSSRKSVPPDTLENESGFLVEEMNAEAHVRRSLRKSVLPNMLNEENQGHSKMARNEDCQSGKGGDEEKQLKVKEPVRQSRRSVATVVFEKENKGLHVEKKSEIHMRRSARKSVSLNAVKKGNRDHTEMVGREQSGLRTRNLKARVQLTERAVAVATSENKLQIEVAVQNNQGLHRSTCKSSNHNLSDDNKAHPGPNKYISCERVGEEGLKLRKRRRSSMEISSPANDSWNAEDFGGQKFRKQQNTQIPNEKDSTGINHEKPLRSQHASNSTTSKGRPAKRRTIVPEEVMSVEEAKSDDMVIREAAHDGDKVTHEYSKESSSRVQEICQVNATREEFSSGPLLVTLPEETCIVQSVHKVIPGSESGDVDKWCQNSETYHSCATENSDKCKQVQELSDIQTDDSHLSETRIGELDQTSSIAELVPHTGIVSENKTLMDEGDVNLAAKSMRIVNAGSYEVGLEALNKSVGIVQEIRSTTDVFILEAEAPIDEGYTVNADTVKQSDEEVASPILSCCDDTTVTVVEPQFSCQKDSQDVSTDDVLPIYFNVGDREEQSPVAGQGRVGREANTSEFGEKNLSDVSLHTKGLQHDINILAKENGVVPIDFTIKEHEERYPVSSVADEKRVSGEANASESAGKTLAGTMSTGLHTKGLQHDCDVLTKETGKASEPALPISDSKQEVHSDAIAEQSIPDADIGNCLSKGSKGNPLSTSLHSEGAADDIILPVLNAAKGCLSDGRHSSFGLKFLFAEECKESYSRNDKNTDCGNKPSASVTPSFYVGSDCGLEDEDVQPIVYDADKKLDADQGGAQEEVVAEEISNDEHVAAKIDLKTKLNDEIVALYMESDCTLAEKNMRLVADNPDGEQTMVQVQQGDVQEDNPDGEQTTVQVQQGDVQEGTLEKPSLCLATRECKHECGLPKEAVLHSVKNKGCSSSGEQSPFGLQSLFSQESIEESVEYGALASATAHIENGVDELKDCHVTCALEKTPVSEPISHHDTHEGSCLVSKDDDCMYTTQQDNGIEGLPNASQANEQVSSSLSVLLVDVNHIKEVITSEEVVCKGEGSMKVVHSEDLNASCEKSDVNGTADNAYGISDAVLSSSLHAPANYIGDVRLGSTLAQLESTDFLDETIGCSNTEVLHQGHRGQCNVDREEQVPSGPCTATAKYIESGVVLLPAEERSDLQDGQLNFKLEGTKEVESGATRSTTCGEIFFSRVGTTRNPSFSLAIPDYKHEGALSEEAMRTMNNYAGTRSSNPRELLMELQSLFSKENIKESDQHDGLAFPSAESRGDESTNAEQRVYVHLGSKLSQLESTDLLDEPIGCSSNEVLHQGYKDRCNEDREEQVASGPCTDDIMEVATAKYIESGVVLLPAEERSNLKDGQLSSKLEGERVMEAGLNCNEDVSNTSDNGSVTGIVGKSTPSGSGLPKDSTDHYQRQELLDGFSVETSLEGSAMFGEKIVSNVGGTIGNPSLSLAAPDYKHECALSEEAARTMKNYAGTCSSNPRQLLMELQSPFSTERIEESDPHDGLAFPSAASGGDESTICHVEKPVDPFVSSEPDTYEGPRQYLSRDEEKEGCMLVSLQDNEQEGLVKSSHMKDWVTSAQFDLSEDAHHIERNIIAEEVLCEEKEKTKSMPTSDSVIRREKSYSHGYGVLHQHHKEEYHEHNEDQVTSGIHAMSKAVPIKVLESGIALAKGVSTSALPDEQLNPELEGGKVEKHSSSCEKDTSTILGTGSVMNKTTLLPDDSHTAYFQEQEIPNDLSAFKSAEESAICLDGSVFGSGICQSSVQKDIDEINPKLNLSRQQAKGIDEISTKVQSFKVSSTVKGSYIAMSAPRQQGDNLSQSAIAWLRNRENTPAVKVDHPLKPKPDSSVVKDSSRRALQPISRS